MDCVLPTARSCCSVDCVLMLLGVAVVLQLDAEVVLVASCTVVSGSRRVFVALIVAARCCATRCDSV